MSDGTASEGYLTRAEESLAGAASELANGRPHNSANRSYYACFQAAIAALTRAGVRPSSRWKHDTVQAQFVGLLINRRRLYPAALRTVLADNLVLRLTADCRTDAVSAIEAARAARRTRVFVEAVRQEGSIK